MYILRLLPVLMVALAMLPAQCALAADAGDGTGPEPDVSVYAAIDPLDPASGEFLGLDIDQLSSLASEQYHAGEYLQSARLYLAYLQHDAANTSAIYNLACCYGLLGEAELAAQYLKRAAAAGFDDAQRINSDGDFDPVRDSDVFQAVVVQMQAEAEEREAGLGEQLKVQSAAFFNCRVKLPADYDPGRPYPLLVALHGFGHWPDGFIKVWERFDDPQFIFVAPQGPYPMDSGSETGYSWITWSETDGHVWRASTNLTMSYVRDVVEAVRSRYYVSDVYLMGFSQGCMMTYKAGIMDHELFAGLLCFGGWLDEDFIPAAEIEAAAAAGLRVFIAHGNTDQVIELETGERARELLEENGCDVTFLEFDGAHQVPEEACLAAQEWLMNPSEPEPVAEAEEAGEELK